VDPTNKTSSLEYAFGDLVAATDPLAKTTRRFVDGAGRVSAVTDPLANQVRGAHDSLNRPTAVTALVVDLVDRLELRLGAERSWTRS
jgi:YD repeat-containing protein